MILVALLAGLSTAAGVFSERRNGERAERGAAHVLTFMLWVLTPPITFVNVVRLEADTRVALGVAFGGAGVLVALGAAWLLGTRVLALPRASTGALMLAGAFGNTGFLGLPVVAALYDGDQLANAIVYDLALTSLGIFTVGFAVGAALGEAGGRRRDRARLFLTRNPPLWACVAGLLAPVALAPDWALDASHALVYALPVLGFYSVGVTLAAESLEDRLAFPPPLDRSVGVALVLKLALVPGVLLGLAALFGGVPRSYPVEAAMATAINTLVIAHQFALDRRLVASAITWSTVLVVAAGLVASLV